MLVDERLLVLMTKTMNRLSGINDYFRRSDIGAQPAKISRRARNPGKMYAVISEGRDLGAYKTQELAQAAAELLPDAYVQECLRSPR